jgi:hypothetical protein
MAEAVFALSYVFARSLLALAISWKPQVAIIGAVLFGANAIATISIGANAPQHWTMGYASLVLDDSATSRSAARLVQDAIGPREMLLLDHWDIQGREIPYWSGISDRYGYMMSVDPSKAEELLRREGPERVGAVVFNTTAYLDQLATGKWSTVGAALADGFRRVQTKTGDYAVFLRK